MTRFLFTTIERSLQQGAVSNAAAAVRQNRVHAAQKRSAAQAQAQAVVAAQQSGTHRTSS